MNLNFQVGLFGQISLQALSMLHLRDTKFMAEMYFEKCYLSNSARAQFCNQAAVTNKGLHSLRPLRAKWVSRGEVTPRGEVAPQGW
jgi:hypothetical protein